MYKTYMHSSIKVHFKMSLILINIIWSPHSWLWLSLCSTVTAPVWATHPSLSLTWAEKAQVLLGIHVYSYSLSIVQLLIAGGAQSTVLSVIHRWTPICLSHSVRKARGTVTTGARIQLKWEMGKDQIGQRLPISTQG